MNLALMKYDWRQWGTLLFSFVLCAVLGTLWGPGPFSPVPSQGLHQGMFFMLATSMGMTISIVGLKDGNIEPWILSRGVTRQSLFRTRWLAGLALILLCGAVVVVLIASGARQAVQQAGGSGWYPMVRWLELDITWRFVSTSLVAFCVCGFLGCATDLGAHGGRGEKANALYSLAQILATFAVVATWKELLDWRVFERGWFLAISGIGCLVLVLAARTAYLRKEIH